MAKKFVYKQSRASRGAAVTYLPILRVSVKLCQSNGTQNIDFMLPTSCCVILHPSASIKVTYFSNVYCHTTQVQTS